MNFNECKVGMRVRAIQKTSGVNTYDDFLRRCPNGFGRINWLNHATYQVHVNGDYFNAEDLVYAPEEPSWMSQENLEPQEEYIPTAPPPAPSIPIRTLKSKLTEYQVLCDTADEISSLLTEINLVKPYNDTVDIDLSVSPRLLFEIKDSLTELLYEKQKELLMAAVDMKITI